MLLVSGGASAMGEAAIAKLGVEGGATAIRIAAGANKLISAGFTVDQFHQLYTESPLLRKAIMDKDYDKAMELGTEMVGQGVMATLGARHGLKDAFESSAKTDAYSDLDAPRAAATLRQRQVEDYAQKIHDQMKAEINSPAKEAALQFYGEARAKANILNREADAAGTPQTATPENVIENQKQQVAASGNVNSALKKATLRGLEDTTDLTDEDKSVLDWARARYNSMWRELNSAGMEIPERADYLARTRWKNDPSSQDLDVESKPANPNKTANHAQGREYDTTVDGILNGEKPAKSNGAYSFSLLDSLHDYALQGAKDLAAKEYNNIASTTFEPGTNRPLAVPVGDAADYENTGSTHTADLTQILGRDGRSLSQDPSLSGMKDAFWDYDRSIRQSKYNNVTVESKPEVIGGPSEPGGAPEGLPAQETKTRFAYHPDIAEEAREIQAPEQSWVSKSAVGRNMLALNSYLKQSSLSLSAFHWVQEGVRGMESGIAPWKLFNLPDLDVQGGSSLDSQLIRAGGIQPGLEMNTNRFSEGERAGGIYEHIPVARDFVSWSNQKLFGSNGFIDRLKMEIAKRNVARLEQHPDFKITDDMTPEQAMQKRMNTYKVAGLMANARTGGLNYLAMQRSRNFQDVLRATVLAPDFLESQIRDTAFALKYPSIGGTDLARIAAYNFVAAQTLNWAISHKLHPETPFGVVSPDGKSVYQIRSMPEDIIHATSDPMGYLSGRIGPVVQTIEEARTGKNNFGQTRDMSQQVKDFIGRFVAAPAGPAYKSATGDRSGVQPSLGNTLASVAGITVKTNHSPAEELATKLSGERASSEAVTPEEKSKRQAMSDFEDRLRNKDKTTIADIQAQTKAGNLAPADVRSIYAAAKNSRLESSIAHLPVDDAIDVWNLATNDERNAIAAEVTKRIGAYRRTEFQKLTPAARKQTDSRIIKLIPELAKARTSDE
jgi:hypothetical protein